MPMIFNPQSILVTGSAGFIGSNFVRYMLAQDEQLKIVSLDKLTYAGSLTNLQELTNNGQHIFIEGDICNRALVDRLFEKYGIDAVVHFAAESHVDNSISGPGVFVQTNVIGTFTLLEASRCYWKKMGWAENRCRFHHISTDEVYGTLTEKSPPFTEKTAYAPNSPYSASKAGSDHLVRAWSHTYGLPVVTTNCSNNYGPYQHQEKFIPTIIKACLERKSIPVYGDGSNIRDWLYVEDHCNGINVVLRQGALGETYNIGGCNEWRNIDICRLICKLMDEHFPNHAPHDELIHFVTDRPGHDWRYAIDQDKIATRLSWTPRETFETGIRKTVLWYIGRLISKGMQK